MTSNRSGDHPRVRGRRKIAALPGPKRPRGRPRKVLKPTGLSPYRVHSALGERLSEATAAAWLGVPLREIRSPSRGNARIAEARQVGMYLAHTVFQRSLTRVGQVFGRDRTTVRHALARIEDCRDERRSDRALDELSVAIARWSADFAQALTGHRGKER